MASLLSLSRAAVAAALFVSGSAFAAYADLAPPPGWVRGGSGAPATMSAIRGSQMANSGEQIIAKIIANAGGRSSAVNARVPLDMAKAPGVAARAIFRSPAAKAIPVIGTWFTIAGIGSWAWDEASKRWMMPDGGTELEDDGYFRVFDEPGGTAIGWGLNGRDACISAFGESFEYEGRVYDSPIRVGSVCRYRSGAVRVREIGFVVEETCAAGYYVRWSDLACVAEVDLAPVDEQVFLDGLVQAPMPAGVPAELPDVSWPVKTPELQPTWVPVGDPVANPDHASDPESKAYKQPGIRIVPANDADNPWRVDVRPEDRFLDEPTPMRDPVPLGDPNDWPAAETDPDTRPSDVDGLCALYPDISACQRLGEPEEAEALPEREIEIEIDAQDWGPADGVCPEPVSISVMGREFFVSWEPLCDLAERVRPLVIAFAWLAAALGVAGFGRQTS